jgi:hypothetical protein
LKGRAVVAVCDLADNPELGRRHNVDAGTIVIYRGGREVARNEGETRATFQTEMSALGQSIPGA